MKTMIQFIAFIAVNLIIGIAILIEKAILPKNFKGGFKIMANTIDAVTEAILKTSPEVMKAHGLLTDAKATGYVCPICGNGTGEDGTGLSFHFDGNHYGTHCFACDSNLNNFHVAAAHYKLDVKRDFLEVKRKLANALGIAQDNSAQNYIPAPKQDNSVQNSAAKSEITATIIRARKFLDVFIEDCGGNWRGLTAETLHKFKCGYLENWRGTPRVIVPTSNYHFLARYVGSNPDAPRQKQHQGEKDIFGLQFIGGAEKIFVTEGEIDAMSIDQLKFAAVALSGSELSPKQKIQFAELDKNIKLIVLFDNDETGIKKSPKVAKALRELGFEVAEARYIADGVKDPNDALQADAKAFADFLEGTLQTAEFTGKTTSAASSTTGGGLVSTQEIFPNCPIDLVIPPEYTITEEGIFERRPRSVKLIAYGHMYPFRSYNSESGEVGQYEVIIYNKVTKNWNHVTVEKTEILESNKFVKLINRGDFEISAERAKKMSTFLCDVLNYPQNAGKVEQKTVYTRTGWNEDFTDFVYPTGRDGKYPVIGTSKLNYEKAFGAKGDRNEWLKMFKKLVVQNSTNRMIFGFVLAAPMLEFLDERNQQMHIWGTSESGKSALCKFAMSAFGKVSAGSNSLRNNFNSTGNYIGQASANFNGFPIYFDEFQAAGNTLKVNITNEIFGFEQGNTKGRLRKDASFATQKDFHSSRLTTGEQPLNSFTVTHGAITRVLELNPKDHLADPALLRKLHGFTDKNYGLIGREWIEYLKAHKEQIEVCFHKYRDEEYGYAFGQDALKRQLPRQHIAVLAAITTALEHFAAFADIMDVKAMSELCWGDAIQYAGDNDVVSTALNAKRALQFIAEITETNHKNFKRQAPVTSNQKFYDAEAPIEYGIKFRNNDHAFHPQKIRELLTQRGFASATAIFEELSRIGALCEGETLPAGRKHQHAVNIDGVTRYMYIFKAEALAA